MRCFLLNPILLYRVNIEGCPRFFRATRPFVPSSLYPPPESRGLVVVRDFDNGFLTGLGEVLSLVTPLAI